MASAYRYFVMFHTKTYISSPWYDSTASVQGVSQLSPPSRLIFQDHLLGIYWLIGQCPGRPQQWLWSLPPVSSLSGLPFQDHLLSKILPIQIPLSQETSPVMCGYSRIFPRYFSTNLKICRRRPHQWLPGSLPSVSPLSRCVVIQEHLLSITISCWKLLALEATTVTT